MLPSISEGASEKTVKENASPGKGKLSKHSPHAASMPAIRQSQASKDSYVLLCYSSCSNVVVAMGLGALERKRW